MKRLNRTYLSAAVAMALAGVGLSGTATAVTLSQDNIGDVGMVPYYTVRDGWATDFNIINTSGKTVAAKVRFHEAQNSREVLDFVIVLSPYDAINGFAVEDPNLGPVVRFPAGNSEMTCVVPIPNGRVAGVGGTLPFSNYEYTGPNDDNDEDDNSIDRAREGYFNVIEMGTSGAGPVYQASIAKDCEFIENAFREENIVETYEEFDRNLNNLKVNFQLTNARRGVQGSGSATMLANFATERSAIAHTVTSIQAGGVEVVAAQEALDAAEEAREEAFIGARDAARALDGLTVEVVDANNATVDLTCTADDDIPPRYDDFPPNAGELSFDAGGGTAPFDPDVNPCEANPAQAGQYDAAVAAYNNSRIVVEDRAEDLQVALATQLGAPLNLIHAQEGRIGYDVEKFPDLNSGDFFAYWFRDGQYRDQGNYDQLPDSFNLPFGLWVGIYPRPVDAVTALLMKSDAINEWAFNANTGASTDLILTAPTKRYYSDFINVYANAPHLVGISPILANQVANINFGWPPFGEQFAQSPEGQACDFVAVGFWNNDEAGPIDPVVPSPTPNVSLCNETNILYTGAESVLASEVGLQLDVRTLLDVANVNETYNGWVNVNMAANEHNYHPAIPVLNVTLPNVPEFWPFDEIVQVGMPYIGYAFKQRDLGNPANAYGGITPHSYLRDWDKRNALGGTITLEDLGAFGPVIIPSVLSWFETNPVLPIDNR